MYVYASEGRFLRYEVEMVARTFQSSSKWRQGQLCGDTITGPPVVKTQLASIAGWLADHLRADGVFA